MPVCIYWFGGFERSLGRVCLLRDVSFLEVPFGLVWFFGIIYGIVLLFGVTLEDAAEKCLRVRERIKHSKNFNICNLNINHGWLFIYSR